jgi:hypothetical protein
METKKCEICGYTVKKSSSVVFKYPDEVMRCNICASTDCYGRFIPQREVNRAGSEQLNEWSAQWDRWLLQLEGDEHEHE